MGRKPKSSKSEPTTPNMHEYLNPSQGAVNTEQKAPLPSKKKVANNLNVKVRRSGRLQSLTSTVENQAKDIVADPIDLVESGNEDERQFEQSDSEPVTDEGNLGFKIDYLIQIVEETKSKVTGESFGAETRYTDLNYKSLYFESQKKVEALREENQQLVKKLEFALGKIEVYEKIKDVVGDLKDTLLFSNLGKATEAVINLSSQTAIGKSCSQDATTLDAPENAAALKAATDNAAEPRASRGKRKKN